MRAARWRPLAIWLFGLAVAAMLVARARYVTDLSAFLPAHPTPLQQLLVDQLRSGPASRLILIALEGGTPAERAPRSAALAQRLRADPQFSGVNNGGAGTEQRDRAFLFDHRYLLSEAVTGARFSTAGLRAAIDDTLAGLASATGLMVKDLVPHDPTGEMLGIVDRLGGSAGSRQAGPRLEAGVWTSADGGRTLLVAETTAAGSDTDAQERALAAIDAAFRADESAPGAAAIRLRASGPGVFAVAARAKIKGAATRLSLLSSAAIIVVLYAVYRSAAALILGLLPVVTGALTGIAAVALGFGAVHGITLGFGITLIGESVDYSIYFFVQSRRRSGEDAAGDWRRSLWPTIRLGMLTSVCGFASLLPSGFPGLAQLGLYSISGLVAAACVTRFVLPELLPRDFAIRDLTPLGLALGRLRVALRARAAGALSAAAWVLAIAAAALLWQHRGTLWNRELSALSPVPVEAQRYDARLRADLGSADVLDLVVVQGATLEAVLEAAERAAPVLQRLVDAGVLGGFDSPAAFLPSLATQQRRRAALPDTPELTRRLEAALAGGALDPSALAPFVADVAAARRAPLLTQTSLAGTSLAQGFDALIMQGSGRCRALLPLHAPLGAGAPAIDVARIAAALDAAHLPDTRILDLKAQTDALYRGYLHEALRLSLYGLALIVLLLLAALRSARRVLGVLAPLLLAVLTVAAALELSGTQLTLLHLVGMLLIVAVGSNYALFFDAAVTGRGDPRAALTLASLLVANVSTVIGFGLLSFSGVPVLQALGETVAPGAFLALLFAYLGAPAPAEAAGA